MMAVASLPAPPEAGQDYSPRWRATLQVAPTMVHKNLVQQQSDVNNIYALGIGGRLKLSKRIAFTWDYSHVIIGMPDSGYYHPLSVGLDKDKYWFNARYSIVSKQDHIAPSYGETSTPSYETFDVRLGVKPIKNVTIGLAALNVFDKNYTNHLNFSFKNQSDFGAVPITESGRNLTAFLQYKF